MDVREVAGGSYGENLPSGAFAVLVPGSHIETHLGRIALPSPTSWPLYLRITEIGGFQIAGQASASAGTWHYREGSGWRLDSRIANGVSGCIFDAAGVLHVLEPGEGVSSQGYRYVADSGLIVLGDATYFSPSEDLNEYTQYAIDGGSVVTIGQGHTRGGAVVLSIFGRRLLDTGSCTFIRFSHAGPRLAVTVLKPGVTVLRWLAVAELASLPVDAVAPSVPPVVTPPVTPPTNPPQPTVPTMKFPATVQAIINALYDRNRALAQGSDDDRRTLQKKIVEQTVFSHPGAGYGWKSAHAHQVAPSKDGMARQLAPFDTEQVAPAGALIGWDCFNGTTRQPYQFPDSIDLTGQYFIPVAGVNHLGAAVPTPTPTPQPPVSEPLAALQTQVALLTGVVGQHDETIARLEATIKSFVARPLPTKAKGRTKPSGPSFLAHSHDVDLDLT